MRRAAAQISPSADCKMAPTAGGKGLPSRLHPRPGAIFLGTQFLSSDGGWSPARRAARGSPAPCTPGQGLCPLEPRFDVIVCQTLGAHAYGQIRAGIIVYTF